MTSSTEQIAPHIERFLNTLDAAFRGYGVLDGMPSRFRDAVAATPRHCFVHRFRIGDGKLRDNDADPAQHLPDIYSDAVMRHVDLAGELLPSSNSQPSYVLFLLHLLDLERGQTVLEIGSGSGWLAAVMARLVGPEGRVIGIELIPELAAQSRADLAALDLDNVEIITGDGTRGHAANAPYDRAIITAATWEVPAVLLDQVAEDGRVLIPIELRGGDGCDVTVLRKRASVFASEQSVPGWFVPLLGDGQDKRGIALVPAPASDVTGRYSLPLGVLGNGGQAQAAELFRTFLGRTEPGFVVTESAADGGWRPGMSVPRFGVPVPPLRDRGRGRVRGAVARGRVGQLRRPQGGIAFGTSLCTLGGAWIARHGGLPTGGPQAGQRACGHGQLGSRGSRRNGACVAGQAHDRKLARSDRDGRGWSEVGLNRWDRAAVWRWLSHAQPRLVWHGRHLPWRWPPGLATEAVQQMA